jgi:hypothetical protein
MALVPESDGRLRLGVRQFSHEREAASGGKKSFLL